MLFLNFTFNTNFKKRKVICCQGYSYVNFRKKKAIKKIEIATRHTKNIIATHNNKKNSYFDKLYKIEIEAGRHVV